MNFFNEVYKCFPISTLETRRESNRGGKIFLPQSALVNMPLQESPAPPMLFKLINTETQQSTHAGVLEFTADEGSCYVPDWLQRFLGLNDGDYLRVQYVSLPVATFAKFQPIGVDFLDITNPKAVLESELRRFACLTIGDIIAISYNQRVYELRVLELLPAQAVSIIYCDMNVDFEQPEGYVDQNAFKSDQNSVGLGIAVSFEGVGVRLDGKNRKASENKFSKKPAPALKGIPDFSYNFGELFFPRNVVSATTDPTSMQVSGSNTHFPGNGFVVQAEKID